MKVKTACLHFLKCSLFLAILAFLFVYFQRHRCEFYTAFRDYSGNVLIAALLCITAGYVLYGALWSPLARSFTGISLPFRDAFSSTVLSLLGRYIPGKVWMVGLRVYFLRTANISPAQVSVLAVIEALAFQAAGILAILGALCFFDIDMSILQINPVILGLLLCIMLCGLHPRVWGGILNSLLRLLGKQTVDLRCNFPLFIAVLFGYVAVYFLWTLGFACLLWPLQLSYLPAELPKLLILLSLAWVSGFLFLIAPAGFGVRDSILVTGLQISYNVTLLNAIVAVAALRLVVTSAELILAFVSVIMRNQELRQYFTAKQNSPARKQN